MYGLYYLSTVYLSTLTRLHLTSSHEHGRFLKTCASGLVVCQVGTCHWTFYNKRVTIIGHVVMHVLLHSRARGNAITFWAMIFSCIVWEQKSFFSFDAKCFHFAYYSIVLGTSKHMGGKKNRQTNRAFSLSLWILHNFDFTGLIYTCSYPFFCKMQHDVVITKMSVWISIFLNGRCLLRNSVNMAQLICTAKAALHTHNFELWQKTSPPWALMLILKKSVFRYYIPSYVMYMRQMTNKVTSGNT